MSPAGGLFFLTHGHLGASSGPERDETEKERLDRNLGELLQELRVALPGVQVLFAFLLVVPFNQRFPEITSFQRTSTSSPCCWPPPPRLPDRAHRAPPHRVPRGGQAAHRLRRQPARDRGARAAGPAMTGAVTLITDFLYQSTTVAIVAGAVALLFAGLWFAWPVKRLLDSGA